MSEPYYRSDSVTLYHGDCRVVLQDVHDQVDTVIADPPYGETALPWDQWPENWPTLMTWFTNSMWVFGSFRMFTDRWPEFKGWKLSQDVVWEKHNGSGFAADRFKRVHEHALHFYTGDWGDVHHQVPRDQWHGPDNARKIKRRRPPEHWGNTGISGYDASDRIARSVFKVSSMHGKALHPTEKPTGVLTPLIEYACPPGGVILDPFAGSGSTAVAALMSGRRAVLVEADERFAEIAARRLSQGVLDFGDAS